MVRVPHPLAISSREGVGTRLVYQLPRVDLGVPFSSHRPKHLGRSTIVTGSKLVRELRELCSAQEALDRFDSCLHIINRLYPTSPLFNRPPNQQPSQQPSIPIPIVFCPLFSPQLAPSMRPGLPIQPPDSTDRVNSYRSLPIRSIQLDPIQLDPIQLDLALSAKPPAPAQTLSRTCEPLPG